MVKIKKCPECGSQDIEIVKTGLCYCNDCGLKFKKGRLRIEEDKKMSISEALCWGGILGAVFGGKK